MLLLLLNDSITHFSQVFIRRLFVAFKKLHHLDMPPGGEAGDQSIKINLVLHSSLTYCYKSVAGKASTAI